MSMEMESLLEEQKKVEKELEAMNAKEGVDFIDENHAAYDKVVEALKKLESDHCVTHEEWSVEEKKAHLEEYTRRKEALLKEKTELVALFEKQLRANEEMPEQKKMLEMHLYSLGIQLSELEKKRGEEHSECRRRQAANDETVKSTVHTLLDCKELLKSYESSVADVSTAAACDV